MVASQIRFLADQQVFDRAGRGIDHRRGDAGGAMAGQDDAMHTAGLGAAQQRAQVLRVLHLVEQQQQRGLAARLGQRQGLVEAGVGIRPRGQGHALMVGPGGRASNCRRWAMTCWGRPWPRARISVRVSLAARP